MNRLLTRRDKNGQHRRSRSADPNKGSANSLLSLFKPSGSPINVKDEGTAKKIKIIREKIEKCDLPKIEDNQIEIALTTKYSDGDPDKAFEIIELFMEAAEGIVRPYNADIYMKGAENRSAVTCWLDSLLFAMFARLGSFEPILYTTFDDEPRRNLSTLIRLWVNMLRTGKLIQTDITKHLQDAMAACGWEDAGRIEQQDTSEAFGFITEKLELPLLTLEMDIFHEGANDDKDDHKLVRERLLEVAVPQAPANGRPIQLEDCLEEHFNTRVEIVRRLERRDTLQRSNTRGSVISSMSAAEEKGAVADHVEEVPVTPAVVGTPDAAKATEEDHTTPIFVTENVALEKEDDAANHETATGGEPEEDIHIRTVELNESAPSTPATLTPTTTGRPVVTRERATSIIRRRVIIEEAGESSSDVTNPRSATKRKASMRKEVLMPAWQFFRIIPWYTTNVPTNDSQVAAHFSSTRPVLGICLKRYAMDRHGRPTRQNTKIDIPLQIALPHFIRDDNSSDGAPIFGNFNLVLQSMVCHRGTSVTSGHYISIIRGGSQIKDVVPEPIDGNDSPPEYAGDKWIRFDDLASERVSYVDIDVALEKEMPYLLFYQVQPLFEEEDTINRPPSYEDSAIAMAEPVTPEKKAALEMVIQSPSPINPKSPSIDLLFQKDLTSYFPGPTSLESGETKARVSFSDDADRPRKSLTLGDAERRGSLAFTDASTNSVFTTSQPVTPGDEFPPSTQTRLSRAASRWTRTSKSKSRPTSVVDESRGTTSSDNRMSTSFSRLNLLSMSRRPDPNKSAEASRANSTADAEVVITSVDGTSDAKPPSNMTGASDGDTEVVHVTNSSSAPVPIANGTLSISGIGIGRSKSTKRRDKDNASDGNIADEAEHHHHHHHLHSRSRDKGKGKAKDSNEPERECSVM